MRKTKIICTIGPACDNEETLTALCKAGMNVARLNFSHGSQEEHLRVYLMNALRREQNLTALQLKLSQLGETAPDETLSNKIANEFQDILEIFGQAFCLKNGDVFLLSTRI